MLLAWRALKLMATSQFHDWPHDTAPVSLIVHVYCAIPDGFHDCKIVNDTLYTQYTPTDLWGKVKQRAAHG